MALNLGQITATLGLDAAGFTSGLQGAMTSLKELGTYVAAAATAASAATIKLGMMASDFNEMSNVMEQAFGKERVAEVEEWAAATGNAMGRATSDIRGMAGGLQAMLVPMVGTKEAAEPMSKALTKLAVDLGSFWNISDSDAINRLKSGMLGEAEALKTFGVAMTEATLKGFLLEKGVSASLESLSEAEKTTLRYNFILDRTATAQGDAIRTGDGFANSLKRVQGEMTNMATEAGTKALPHMQGLLNVFEEMLQVVKGGDLSEGFRILASAIKTVADTALQSLSGIVMLVDMIKTLHTEAQLAVSGLSEESKAQMRLTLYAEEANPVLEKLIKLRKALAGDGAEAPKQGAGAPAGTPAPRGSLADQLAAARKAGGVASGPSELASLGSQTSPADILAALGGMGAGGMASAGTDPALEMLRKEQQRMELEGEKAQASASLNMMKGYWAARHAIDQKGISDAALAGKSAAAKLLDTLTLQSSKAATLSRGVLGAAAGGSAAGVAGAMAQSAGMQGADITAMTQIGSILQNLATKVMETAQAAFQALGNAWKATGGAVLDKLLSGPLASLMSNVTSTMGTLMAALGGLAFLVFALGAPISTVAFLLGGPLAAAITVLVVALAPLGVAAVTAAMGLFSLATQTKSFERFQKGVQAVGDKLVSAVEPFFERMMPLIGLASLVGDAFSALVNAMVPSEGIFKLVFEVFRLIAAGAANVAIGMQNLRMAGVFLATSLLTLAQIVVTAGQQIALGFSQIVVTLMHTLQKIPGVMFSQDAWDAANGAVTQAQANIASSGQAFTAEFATLSAEMDAAVGDRSAAMQTREAILTTTYTEMGKLAGSLTDVRKASDSVTESLSNVPSGYKVALARFNNTKTEAGEFSPGAMGGAGGIGGASGVGVGVATFNVGTVIVQANNVETLEQQLSQMASRKNFMKSGTTNIRPTRPFAFG